MAALVHVKSGAANSSPYATWANAATTLASAAAVAVAGDDILLSPSHSEAGAGVNVTIAGSSTSITRMLCGTEGASSGITAMNTGAVIESTNTTYTLSGSFYADGVTYKSSSGSSVVALINSASAANQHHRNCRFEFTGAGAASAWKFGAGTSSASVGTVLTGCIFKFGNANQRISIDGALVIRGGSIDAAGTALNGIFSLANSTRGNRLICDDFDASACAAAVDIIGQSTQSGSYVRIRRIKLPSSWTGNLIASGNLKVGDRFEMIDFSSGTTRYRAFIDDYAGRIRDEPTIKVTANDHSYKLVSNANCSFLAPLLSQEYFVPLSGSSQTLTIPICTDNVTLTDADVYIEVSYFASSTSSLGTVATDAAASVIATPANQTTSSVTWTTTGLTTPVRQELAVTLTAGMASHAIARVVLLKASTTVYLDDRVTVA